MQPLERMVGKQDTADSGVHVRSKRAVLKQEAPVAFTCASPGSVAFSEMSYRFSAMLHIPGDVRDAIAFYERAFGATAGWSTPIAADMVA